MPNLIYLILFIVLSVSTHSSGLFAETNMAYLKQVGSKRLVVTRNINDQKKLGVENLISSLVEDTYHPEMAPNGKEVAYSRGIIIPGKKVSIQLVTQNLLTQEVEEWTQSANQFIHAEYSGNSRFLVFSGPNSKSAKQNIGIIDLVKERKLGPVKTIFKNGKKTKIFKPSIYYIESNYDCYAPAVSSNGLEVIYHRTLDSSSKSSPKEIVLYNTQTNKKTLLTEPNGHAMFPTLSDDDRHMAYVSKSGGVWDIYRIDLWNNKKFQVTNDPEIEFTPVFGPENSLFFTRFSAGKIGVPSEIGVYFLSEAQTFSHKNFPRASEFLDEENVAEYVPSFSGELSLSTKSMPAFPAPARSSFGAINHQNKIYIVGGHQGPEHTYPKESFLGRTDVYDLKNKNWSQVASMQVPKHGFQLVANGNFLYAFGGFAYSADHTPAWKSLDVIERYDIKKNIWEILNAKLTVPRSSNVSVKVGSKVYLIGGWDSTPKSIGDKEGSFLKSIDVFDLLLEKTRVSNLTLPNPLRRAFNATVKGDRVYLLGGISEGSSHFDWVDNVTVLNTRTKKWSEEKKMPYATFAPAVGFLQDKLYLIGGMVLKNAQTYDLDYVDDIYEYDFNKKTWQHTGKYLKENKGFPQIVPITNKSLGILGGHTYIQDQSGRTIDHPVSTFELFLKY